MDSDDFQGLIILAGLVGAGLVITSAFMYRRLLSLDAFFELYED